MPMACFVDDQDRSGRIGSIISATRYRGIIRRNCLATLVHILPRFASKPLDPGGSASASTYRRTFAPAPRAAASGATGD
jgi:hypothetical protein